MFRLRALSLFSPLVVLALMACDNNFSYGLDSDPTVLPEGTSVEPWGIGDTWYDYEFSGAQAHTVLPRDISWVVKHPDGDAFHIVIDGYYGPDGKGGYPRMSVREWTGDDFGDARTWEAEQSIREESLCLDFARVETVPCSGAYDAIWRIDLRPVPEVGFPISNPGFYLSTENGEEVFELDSRGVPSALPTNESEDAERIQSIFDHDAKPLLSLSLLTEEKSVFHLLASLSIAEWQVREDDESDALVVRARCVFAEYEHKRTDEFAGEPASLTLPRESLETWTFIDLCGTTRTQEELDQGEPQIRVTDEAGQLRVGQWERNDTFSIALQKTDAGMRLWVSPDQPFEVRHTDAFEPTAAPEGLWSIP